MNRSDPGILLKAIQIHASSLKLVYGLIERWKSGQLLLELFGCNYSSECSGFMLLDLFINTLPDLGGMCWSGNYIYVTCQEISFVLLLGVTRSSAHEYMCSMGDHIILGSRYRYRATKSAVNSGIRAPPQLCPRVAERWI